MYFHPDIPSHIEHGKHHEPKPTYGHPRKQNTKVLPKVAFRTEYDCTSALDGVVEGKSVAVEVEIWHQFERGEGPRHVDNDPLIAEWRSE